LNNKVKKEESKNFILSGARVIDPSSNLDTVADISVEKGIIKRIETKKKSYEGKKVFRLKGKIVVPGLIDMHTHLREPGREDEETIYSGCASAVVGGFVAVCCMPNTEPPLDNQEAIKFIYQKADQSLCRVFPVAAITKGLKGEEITEIADLAKAGAVAISDDGRPVMNALVMRNALEYAKMYHLTVISHCEDLNLSAEGMMNESFVSTLLGIKGIPSMAEEIMVARDIKLAEFTRGKIHIAHISTLGSVELIRRAKDKGIKVTCEATPHHFSLTDEIIKTFNTNAKVNPPLRTEKDVEAIKNGLQDGAIDCIASDHAPHSIEEKDVEFDAASFGMVGLETTLGLVITELVNTGILSWKEAIAKLTLNPAKILNLSLGKIKVGGSANLTVIDPELEWIVDSSKFHSKSKNTPFEGRKLKGKAVMTIVGGEIAYKF
jgi:dihydroorotase